MFISLKGFPQKVFLLGLLLSMIVLAGCGSSGDSDSQTDTSDNEGPVAVMDEFSVAKGSQTTLNLSLNDSDKDDGLDLSSISIVTTPDHGSLVVNDTGTVDYTHDGVNTDSDEFSYTILDNSAAVSNVANVVMTITQVPVQNESPVANDDSFSVLSASVSTLDLAANDFDKDDGLDLAGISIVDSPVNGNVMVNNTGTVDYNHDGGDSLSDVFSYTIRDDSGVSSNTATVTMSITPVVIQNEIPQAVDDTFTVDNGSQTSLNLLSNDSDADDGLDLTSILIVTSPVNGNLVVNNTGLVDYTHDGGNTLSDEFSYTVKDISAALSNTASVTLSIRPVVIQNEIPQAVDDAFTVENASSTNLNLIQNDNDADDGLDLSSITIIDSPDNGSVVVNSNGTVDYTHDGGNTLSDIFKYNIKDKSSALSNTATVSLTILPVVTPVNVKAGLYDSTVVEGADHLEFVVSLFTPGNETVSVDYHTEDGTAVSATDYSTTSGSLIFSPGEIRKFVTVPVLINPVSATVSSRNMRLVLDNPQHVDLVDDFAIGTIIDSDSMSTDDSYDHNWAQIGAFTNAETCGASCHKASDPKLTFAGKDISPGTQWKHSVMANAFADPYWQAAVEDEVDSFPQLTGFIENTCIRCHAPMGSTQAHYSGTGLDADGYYRFDTAKTDMHSRAGVSCSACHQIEAGNLGSSASFSGGFTVLNDPSNPDYKNMYGPYGSPVGSNMLMQTGHQPTEGVYVSESELCATCHTLYTPTLHPETGIPTGGSFLEQGPYLEWQNSDFASGQTQEAQCQDCHMPEPEANYSTPISLLPNSAPNRSPYGQHTLPGGNAHLLEILRDYRSELGLSGSTSVAGFNDQISETRNFLNNAASITLSAPVSVADTLQFSVEISNHAGHKMPSAYPSRRMWLHVTVKDKNDNIIFESGKPDARGYISTDEKRLKADCMSAHKLEGFDSQLCYETHRDVINDQSQVAIYETVLGDVNDHITHTLLQGSSYLKDNRIPPSGFTNDKAATIETQTIPAGVTGDNDFNCVNSAEGCGADTVHYQVNIAGKTGPFTVDTRLLYQATQPGFVNGMHNVGDRVNRFKIMYDSVPPSVEILDTATR